MAVDFHITRKFGHPWSQLGDWDLMEVQAETEEELDKFVAKAETKFWQVWIRDGLGGIRAVMYKPSGISKPWTDNPNCPQPTMTLPTNESP